MSTREGSPAGNIRRSAERLRRSRSKRKESALLGFSVFGIVGWSIAVPTVAGALLGHWLNQVAPQKFSWTIALILGGVVVGVIIAIRWLSKVTFDEGEQKGEE